MGTGFEKSCIFANKSFNQKINMKKIFFVLFSIVLFLGCSNNDNNSSKDKTKDIISIVDSVAHKLFQMESAEELGNLHVAMIDSIKHYLINNNNGAGFVVEDQEYQEIIDRLRIYNHTFLAALSKYNPNMNWSPIESENEDIAKTIAIMQTMEERALKYPEGNDSIGNNNKSELIR